MMATDNGFSVNLQKARHPSPGQPMAHVTQAPVLYEQATMAEAKTVTDKKSFVQENTIEFADNLNSPGRE